VTVAGKAVARSVNLAQARVTHPGETCTSNQGFANPRPSGGLCTSALRAFCPDYFPHFASGLEPRHIGARPKGTPFGLGYHPKP